MRARLHSFIPPNVARSITLHSLQARAEESARIRLLQQQDPTLVNSFTTVEDIGHARVPSHVVVQVSADGASGAPYLTGTLSESAQGSQVRVPHPPTTRQASTGRGFQRSSHLHPDGQQTPSASENDPSPVPVSIPLLSTLDMVAQAWRASGRPPGPTSASIPNNPQDPAILMSAASLLATRHQAQSSGSPVRNMETNYPNPNSSAGEVSQSASHSYDELERDAPTSRVRQCQSLAALPFAPSKVQNSSLPNIPLNAHGMKRGRACSDVELISSGEPISKKQRVV